LAVTKLRTGDNTEFVFGADFETGIANVGSFNFETVELGLKHAETERAQSDNAGADTVFWRSSEVAFHNKAAFEVQIMFCIINKMNSDLLMITRWWSPLSPSCLSICSTSASTEIFHWVLPLAASTAKATFGSINSQGILTILGNKHAKDHVVLATVWLA
jgi:hypothetical protein